MLGPTQLVPGSIPAPVLPSSSSGLASSFQLLVLLLGQLWWLTTHLRMLEAMVRRKSSGNTQAHAGCTAPPACPLPGHLQPHPTISWGLWGPSLEPAAEAFCSPPQIPARVPGPLPSTFTAPPALEQRALVAPSLTHELLLFTLCAEAVAAWEEGVGVRLDEPRQAPHVHAQPDLQGQKSQDPRGSQCLPDWTPSLGSACAS